jgi:hypothetical protein
MYVDKGNAYSFGGKGRKKQTTRRHRRWWKNIIKIDVMEIVCGVMD